MGKKGTSRETKRIVDRVISHEEILIDLVRRLPIFFEKYMAEQGQIPEDADLLKAVRILEEGSGMWTFFCAIINRQCPIATVLIPMCSALAQVIKHRFGTMHAFLDTSPTLQRTILEQFTWVFTTTQGISVQKTGWGMHRFVKVPEVLCIFTN